MHGDLAIPLAVNVVHYSSNDSVSSITKNQNFQGLVYHYNIFGRKGILKK